MRRKTNLLVMTIRIIQKNNINEVRINKSTVLLNSNISEVKGITIIGVKRNKM